MRSTDCFEMADTNQEQEEPWSSKLPIQDMRIKM